jgi:lysine 2,3-aminomutase
VKPGKHFLYFDPLHQLSTTTQRRWAEPAEQQQMVDDALAKAKAHLR